MIDVQQPLKNLPIELDPLPLKRESKEKKESFLSLSGLVISMQSLAAAIFLTLEIPGSAKQLYKELIFLLFNSTKRFIESN